MFDQLVERFGEFDDFCQAVRPQWEATLMTDGQAGKHKPGPKRGLADAKIMTRLVLYHSSRFKHLKAFYNGIVLTILRPDFPSAPCYKRFLTITSSVWPLLVFFLVSRVGARTGIYYIDSTPLVVGHNRRISRHKVFAG